MLWVMLLILYKPLSNVFSVNGAFMNIYEVCTWISLVLTAVLTIVSFAVYVYQNISVLKDNEKSKAK